MPSKALVEERVVRGQIAGSRAERAGLREGDRIEAVGIYWNDMARPVKLTVRRGTNRVITEYLPVTETTIPMPRYVER